MIRPRNIKRYCPGCQKHTEQGVDRVKKRKASEFKWGQRRFRRIMRGYRGFPRPKPEGREKPTRRVNLVYTCSECKRKWSAKAQRAKKFEIKEH